MYLLNWPAAHLQGPESAGGKGWNLGRLNRYGLAVPDGGVVSAEAYRLFIDHPDLREQVADLVGVKAADAALPEVAEKLAHLRERILTTALPAAVAGELHGFLAEAGLLGRPVAVRSSATAEDSAVASFAGIHHSFLNVYGPGDITAAVKGCYASLWTPQAVAYRRKMGLPDQQVAAAVVILAMVPAKAAGVAFSCDPRTGRLDRFTISASVGLGESVVSGTVEPDEYEVDITQYPPAVVRRRIGTKAQATVARTGGGTELVATAAAEAGRPALTDGQIAELAYLVGRIQDALGHMTEPQDVEWAHDGERFWVVQARPVTNLPPATFAAVAGEQQVWSNANLKDVMPGVQSTMGWSFLRSGIDTLLSAPLRAAGYGYPGGIGWVRLFEGRAYFNLTAMQWAFYDALGIKPHEFNRQIGGHQPEIRVAPPTLPDRLRRGSALARMLRHTFRIQREAPAEFQRLWDWADSAEQQERTGWEKARLVQESLQVKAIMDQFLPKFQLINGAAGGTHQELIRALEASFGERASALANAMLAGASMATSAQQGERLVALGNLALSEPRAKAYFAAKDWAPGAWAERLEGTRFKSEFETYLRDYGHRGVYELEIMNPRWREEPAYLLETVRGQVLSGKEIRLENQEAKRETAKRAVFGKLGWGPAGLRARYFLKQAARSAALREMAKSMVVKVAGVSRLTALEVGRRLVAEGHLDSIADVFHLSWLDMEAYLTGRGGQHGFRALAHDRKLQRETFADREPPDVIMGETPVKKAALPAATGDVLTGLGVATGRATGACRVILHPHEGIRLQPGDVLVAPSTDPAWTPLFLRAAAVVTEVGGYLSHGAIVAREYGLPAVVNIPGLLQSVKDGETLTVDGDEGKVYRTR